MNNKIKEFWKSKGYTISYSHIYEDYTLYKNGYKCFICAITMNNNTTEYFISNDHKEKSKSENEMLRLINVKALW